MWQDMRMQTEIPSIQQIQAVLQALPKGELTRISRDSGVPFGTLWKVRSGETPNPGIETVRSFLPHLPQDQSAAGQP